MKRVSKEDLRIAKRISYDRKPLRYPGGVTQFKQGELYMDLIQQAQACWNALYDVRKRARRAFNFYRGKQWGDIVEVNGVKMTEEAYLEMQGRPPLKQNLIRPPMRNILGQFRSSPYKSVVYSVDRKDQTASEMMTVSLERAYSMNNGKERDARMLESYLVGASAIYETSFSYDHVRKKAIPKFRAVNLNRFFYDTETEDVEGEDIQMVGEIVDLSLLELIATYAKTERQEDDLRKIYSSVREMLGDSGRAHDETKLFNQDFLIPSSTSKCRVIKVCTQVGEWRLKAHDYLAGTYEDYPLSEKAALDEQNEERKRMAQENDIDIPLIEYEVAFIKSWYYYHLASTGYCLWESRSPYWHNSHPYVFQMYPMLNNAVWSLVEDLIDQQKMVNRSIILWDFINSASAKGVLLVPEESIPDDMSIDDFAEEWVKYNGVIKIKAKNGAQMPEQIRSNTINPGLTEMINMQMKLLQDIGGVHGAIQGKTPSSGTPAALYMQETANASLNTLDVLESFASFCKKRDYKILQLIRQYYTDKHYQAIGSTSVSADAEWYDPQVVRNLDFDNEIRKGQDAPTYKVLIEDMLWKMLEAQYINIEMFLENSSLPFSDKILTTIRSQKEMVQEGKLPDGMNDPALMDALSQQKTQLGMQDTGNTMNPNQ